MEGDPALREKFTCRDREAISQAPASSVITRETWWKGWLQQPNPTSNQPLKKHPPASPTRCHA